MSDGASMDEQRVLVVTGASSGIGAALALRASRAGYAVVAVGRNITALETLRDSVALEGGRVTIINADVRDTASSRKIVEAARTAFGRIDVLVANAGIAGRGPLALQSDEELREQIETHVYAPLRLIREALPLLHVSRGATFVVGSGVARIPIGGMGLYPASKAALRSAARTLRRELQSFGIGVTYVDPGVVDTAFMKRKEMPGAPAWLLVSPHTVARAILRAVAHRPAEVNASPWQTMSVGIGEFFPRITDFVMSRADALTGVTSSTFSLAPAPIEIAQPELTQTVTESIPALRIAGASDALATALEPFLGRMERAKLPLQTMLDALRHDAVFSEDEFALSWVGMPNKNERKLISDIALALHNAGFLEGRGDRNWAVRLHAAT